MKTIDISSSNLKNDFSKDFRMQLNDIYAAEERLRPYLKPTPLIFSSVLERHLNKKIWLKLETQQPTGSFKPRPAFNNILSHLEFAKKNGVIASSSGNFAQGVAYAARELGISAVIVMMKKTSTYKIERTKNLGAEVVLCENTNEDRIKTTDLLQRKSGRLLLHPYDSNETIAGDGTLGLELSNQLGEKLNESMTILVPVSGAGLLAGIAFTLKNLHPKCKVIGLQPKANGSLLASVKAGRCVNVGPIDTIADALVASSPGEKSFALVREYVDDVVLVEEEDIKSTTRFLIEEHKLVVEHAAAVPVAAILKGLISVENCVCIISGGNLPLMA